MTAFGGLYMMYAGKSTRTNTVRARSWSAIRILRALRRDQRPGRQKKGFIRGIRCWDPCWKSQAWLQRSVHIILDNVIREVDVL